MTILSQSSFLENVLNVLFFNKKTSVPHIFAAIFLLFSIFVPIQALLGYKHSKTTEIYTHVITKSIQKIKCSYLSTIFPTVDRISAQLEH